MSVFFYAPKKIELILYELYEPSNKNVNNTSQIVNIAYSLWKKVLFKWLY